MTTNQSEDEGLREELKKYNWSSDKDYQLAVIASKALISQKITAAEQRMFIAGKINEIEGLYRYGHISKELYDKRVAELKDKQSKEIE